MQEFLLNNTVNCNLMSLTGYRTLVILGLLMIAPRSKEEINDFFLNNQYIKEKFSNDTLRIYINSLRAIGCEITRANKSTNNKFELLSHPFDFEIAKSQLKALSKLYNHIHDKIEVNDVLAIESVLKKLESCVKNEKQKEYIKNISLFKNINSTILKDLTTHCKNKNQIIIRYKSPRSGEKEIELIADKLEFKSEKLYLWGTCLNYGEYAYFRLDRIAQISAIKIKKDEIPTQTTKVIYELYNQTEDYSADEYETIKEKTADKIVIEAYIKNKFEFIQKVLYFAQDCKIIQPKSIQQEIIQKLESMKEAYIEKA